MYQNMQNWSSEVSQFSFFMSIYIISKKENVEIDKFF